jgi:hypothetical protein
MTKQPLVSTSERGDSGNHAIPDTDEEWSLQRVRTAAYWPATAWLKSVL